MPLDPEMRAKMDAGAVAAEKALKELPKEVVVQVADWAAAHKAEAGLKRLARVLIARATPPPAEKASKAKKKA